MQQPLRLALTLLAVLLASAASLAQDEEPEPGHKIRERTAKDVAALLPQPGVGGSPTAKVEGEPGIAREFKIDEEGCEKMKGYVCVPPGLDKSKKYPLVFAFISSFWRPEDTKTDMQDIVIMSDGRDPMIVCAVQYVVTRKEGDTTHISPAADTGTRFAGFMWTLKKMLKDHPVDPERVFLVGAYGATQEAVSWACSLWSDDPDAFPFRAILIDGLVFESADSMPHVPLIITVDKSMDSHSRRSGYSDSARKVVNDLMALGIPCQFHVYEDKFVISFNDSGPSRQRWQVIMRDAMQSLGGPGPREYADAKPAIGSLTPADAVPFGESIHPVVAEVIMIAKAEEWARANRRLTGYLAQRGLKAPDKKPAQDFKKVFDKYVKDEMERCNKSIEISIKAEAWAHSLHRSRLAAMVEAFGTESWAKNKPYAANLEKLKTYPPAVRDNARREKMLEAIRLELSGEREAAKAKYEAIAKQKEEDGGYSDWPRAAEYRLSWWVD